MEKIITCIECPKGCQVSVELGEKGDIISIKGNGCERGYKYAESEIVCPRRVLTTTVKVSGGEVVSVKSDNPIKKSNIFKAMQKINQITVDKPIKIGDIIIENIEKDINIIATDNK